MVLRITSTLVAIVSGLGIAYAAVWIGLGGNTALSEANVKFAISVGWKYALALAITINCFSYRNKNRTAKVVFGIIGGAHLAFGFVFMVWVAGAASV